MHVAYGSLLLAMASRLTGDYDRAIAMSERCAQTSKQIGLAYIAAPALCELGNSYIDLSPRLADKANEVHKQALATVEMPLGTALGAAVWADIGFCLLIEGDLDGAAQTFRRGLDEPSALNLFVKPQLELGLGLIAATRGEMEEAAGLLESAKAYAAERGMAFFAPLANMALGMYHGGTQQPTAALEHFEEAEQGAEAMGMLPTLWQARAAMAGVLTTLGKQDEADEKRKAASSVIDRIAEKISDAELRSEFVGNATSKLP
jgi:tetratricopeptide (TPR) repeat protein